MARTKVTVDGDLLKAVMRRYRLHTRGEAVDLAIRRLLGPSVTRQDLLALEGIGWEGDLETMREAGWTTAPGDPDGPN